jgi:hypothetical protein
MPPTSRPSPLSTCPHTVLARPQSQALVQRVGTRMLLESLTAGSLRAGQGVPAQQTTCVFPCYRPRNQTSKLPRDDPPITARSVSSFSPDACFRFDMPLQDPNPTWVSVTNFDAWVLVQTTPGSVLTGLEMASRGSPDAASSSICRAHFLLPASHFWSPESAQRASAT